MILKLLLNIKIIWYMDYIWENIEEYNSGKERNTFIVFDDIIAVMFSNKKLYQIVTELFIRCRKLNIFVVFYHTIIFCCTKKYQTKFFTLLCYDNIKQMRASTNVNHNHSSDVIRDYESLQKNVLQNHILFKWLIPILHQIILYVLVRIL